VLHTELAQQTVAAVQPVLDRQPAGCYTLPPNDAGDVVAWAVHLRETLSGNPLARHFFHHYGSRVPAINRAGGVMEWLGDNLGDTTGCTFSMAEDLVTLARFVLRGEES
jgi:hypothetical protein